MMTNLRVCVMVAAIIARLSGQQLIIVDPFNGPGSNYTDISVAVAAANHKDRILYRNPVGGLSSLVINKGITIMPDMNQSITSPRSLVIQDVPAGESVTLVGFGVIPLFGSWLLTIKNCDGPIIIDNCGFGKIDIVNCKLVSFMDSGWGVLAPVGSHIVMSRCVCMADVAPFAPPIQGVNSRIDCADSWVQGDDGDLSYPTCYIARNPGVAATLNNCSLLFHGDHNYFRGGYMNGGITCAVVRQAAAIIASNNCVISTVPGMLLSGAINGSYTLVSEPKSSLVASYPLITDWAEVEVGATSFASVGLFMSIPTLPYTTALGELYLDPMASWWVTNDACDVAGRFVKDYVVPASVPRGLTVLFQAATVSPVVGFKLTNPSMVCLTRRSDH